MYVPTHKREREEREREERERARHFERPPAKPPGFVTFHDSLKRLIDKTIIYLLPDGPRQGGLWLALAGPFVDG